jgi:hypothetical protein
MVQRQVILCLPPLIRLGSTALPCFLENAESDGVDVGLADIIEGRSFSSQVENVVMMFTGKAFPARVWNIQGSSVAMR